MLACTLEQLVHSVFVVFALSKHNTGSFEHRSRKGDCMEERGGTTEETKYGAAIGSGGKYKDQVKNAK